MKILQGKNLKVKIDFEVVCKETGEIIHVEKGSILWVEDFEIVGDGYLFNNNGVKFMADDYIVEEYIYTEYIYTSG